MQAMLPRLWYQELDTPILFLARSQLRETGVRAKADDTFIIKRLALDLCLGGQLRLGQGLIQFRRSLPLQHNLQSLLSPREMSQLRPARTRSREERLQATK
jgi:hypothetical protein